MSLVEMKWHTDEKGNMISVSKQEEIQVSPASFEVILDEIPNELKGIEVTDEEGKCYTEVDSLEMITSNTYYVDYANGIVKFSPSLANKTLQFNYFGKGFKRIDASRMIGLDKLVANEIAKLPSSHNKENYEILCENMETRLQILEKQIDFLVKELEKLNK